jgi:hypothetical protein
MIQIPAWNFGDQLGRMPVVAQRKFRKLVAELEDVQSLLKNTLEREGKVEARAHYLNHSRERASLPTGDPDQAARLATEWEQAQGDYAELLATRSRLNAKHAELTNLTSRLQHTEIPNIYGWLVPVAVDAQPQEGEDLVAAVERTRSELYQKQGALAATRQAPLPREELLAMCRTTVNTAALNGLPLVISHGGKFTIQWDRISVPGYPASSDNFVPRLLAALFPEELFQLLASQIPDLPGIDAAERREREAELERQILQLEHEEESLIVQAQAKGLDMPRRRDASAYALLGCDPGHLHVPQLVQAAE